MPRYDAKSRCSGPDAPVFRWYGSPGCQVGDDVETAVDVLFDAISPPGRLWNPYAKSIVRAEFRKRIEKAERGELQPVDEVKPVDVSHPPPLYEIRWQDIAVTTRESDGTQSFGEALVRMYHSEPTSRTGHFVGHHAHEKDVTVADVNAAQQLEIAKAIVHYKAGESSKWGIAAESPPV